MDINCCLWHLRKIQFKTFFIEYLPKKCSNSYKLKQSKIGNIVGITCVYMTTHQQLEPALSPSLFFVFPHFASGSSHGRTWPGPWRRMSRPSRYLFVFESEPILVTLWIETNTNRTCGHTFWIVRFVEIWLSFLALCSTF